MLSIYLSSTYVDLVPYRAAVLEALRRQGHRVVCMEDYGASDQRPLQRCLSDVDRCDIYMAIIAWRYGYRPTEQNPTDCSITELEYRRALDRNKPCLVFLHKKTGLWSAELVDRGSEGDRVAGLRQRMGAKHLIGEFSAVAELAGMANSAVASWMARNRHSAELLGPEPQPNPRPAQPSGVQRTFSGHVDTIETVAISNDGTKGASAGCDKSIFLWDLAVGRLLRRLDGHSASASAHGIVSKVAFAPDGTQLVSCGYDGAVRVWDVASGKQTRALTGHIGPITGLSMGGRQLLTAGADRSLRCWDLDGFRQQVVVETHPSSIAAATMTKDGALLLTGGKDSVLRFYDLAVRSGTPKAVKASGHLLCLDLDANGLFAVCGDNEGLITVWECATGRLARRLDGHTGAVRQVVISKDSRYLVSASNDRTIRLWDLGSGTQLMQSDDHTCPVLAVAMSGDGTIALSAGADRIIRLWRLPI